MRGYIVDETYRMDNGKAYIYLFGRLENGESFLTINAYSPYFFIKEDDSETAKAVSTQVPFSFDKTSKKSFSGDDVIKVIFDNPRDAQDLRKAFEQHKITCYEADLRFTQRFLLDLNILRSVEIEGTHANDVYVNRVYLEPKLSSSDWYPSLRVLSLDIETSMDSRDLYCISLICEDEKFPTREVLFVNRHKDKNDAHSKSSKSSSTHKNDTETSGIADKNSLPKILKDLNNAKVFNDEQSLLEHFRTTILRIDPDVITGWNLIDFDLAFIKKKFEQHKIPFKMARQDWDCALRIESSFLKDSKADFPGRQVLDGIHLLKMNFVKLDDYKLGTAAHELLGEEKLIGDENKGKEIEDSYLREPQKLIDYNLKDSELVLSILKKTNAVDLTVNRTMLTGMSLERVRGSVASFDSLYLRELAVRGIVANSSQYSEKEEAIGGGYVMESKPGIYDNIIVLDFKSLYPSIICTFNIDPHSFAQGLSAKEPEKHKDKWIIAPNGAVFSHEPGILPQIIMKLWHARDAAKKRKDDLASFAIKVHMNSFFGVLANPSCRFFSMDMANAITSFGRHLIKLTMQLISEMGYEVIYGDTDSVFIDAKCARYDDALTLSEKIEHKINAFYEKHIPEEYRSKSFMELEVDKVFLHFIMPRVRGSEEGSKKRYAGLLMGDDGKQTLDVTGLEMVRRDWTELAKTFQQKMLELVFEKQDPAAYVRQFVKDLKSGKLDELLVYRKAIRKELEGYTKTTPPHVKAARKLEEAGIPLTSTLIEYVMTESGPDPLPLRQAHAKKTHGGKLSPIDYDHYIDKQLRPIADGILCFYDVAFDDLLQGHSQKTLFGF